MSRPQVVALAWVIVVLGLVAVHFIAPQRSGVLALTQVLEPYIVLTGLISAALLIRAPDRARAVAIVLVLVTAGRYGPTWISFPVNQGGDTLTVATWNMEAGPDADTRALEGFGDIQADLVAIQELQPAAADALLANPTLASQLPYSVMKPDSSVLGVGLMSRFPILDERSSTDPPYLRAMVDAPSGPHMAVYVVHPLPARFVTVAGVPVALDTTRRDAAITEIRSGIDTDLATGLQVLILGDINTTQREPAYTDLSTGFRDAHLDVGVGPGNTWLPGALEGLPFGLLRIDYVFADPNFVFESTYTDCSLPSDHCLLQATLRRGSEL